jgi:D-glycero-alpha-D-manno-heptose-7-phosphate kinase
MIISKTPFRVSLAGGGTDLPAYYQRGWGAVTTLAICKYMYVTLNRKFDDRIRVSYSQTEVVDSLEQLQHDLVRECLRFVGIQRGVEITTVADVPSRGTGLGSSSALAVGLLNALHAFKGEYRSPRELAEEACEIEIGRLKKPIGKQDQYIAAFGGAQYFRFLSDGTVLDDPVIMDVDRTKLLAERLVLYHAGGARRAEDILSHQNARTEVNAQSLGRLRELATAVRDCLASSDRDLDALGSLLEEGWRNKRSLAPGIATDVIDAYYRKGLDAGALGGKLLGAGGGGFLLLYVSPERRDEVREALAPLRELPLQIARQGSKIIYLGQ